MCIRDSPNLCHNGELKHYGGCSLCVVEAEGSPKLLRACSTEAQDGQVIYTESERVVRTRKTSIELLMLSLIHIYKMMCYRFVISTRCDIM